MVPYKKERLENAICFFIQKQKEIAKKPAYKMYIYKYLALFDFAVLKETGRPALELEYRAMENGPVPMMLYNDIGSFRTDTFKVIDDGDGKDIYESDRTPDLDYFSETEIEILKSIASKYMSRGMIVKPLCKKTHKEIKAWDIAWKRRSGPSEVMSYDDTFPNIHEKKLNSLTAEEDSFLSYKATVQY